VDRNNFYIFLVTNNGVGAILKKADGEYEELESEDIEGVKSNKLNHISAVCNGEDLELYVNGDLVLSTSDSDFAKGRSGCSSATAAPAGPMFSSITSSSARYKNPGLTKKAPCGAF